jgi:tRNA dimethylallyltransferase
MFAAGLVEEVEALLHRYGSLGPTAVQAVGYREVQRHLRDRTSLEETIRKTQARTRQFAKRQLTWFRSLCECRWLPREEDESREELIEQIVALGQQIVR